MSDKFTDKIILVIEKTNPLQGVLDEPFTGKNARVWGAYKPKMVPMNVDHWAWAKCPELRIQPLEEDEIGDTYKTFWQRYEWGPKDHGNRYPRIEYTEGEIEQILPADIIEFHNEAMSVKLIKEERLAREVFLFEL